MPPKVDHRAALGSANFADMYPMCGRSNFTVNITKLVEVIDITNNYGSSQTKETPNNS